MALRKDQLTNVAFGGEWSEQIERRELLQQVIRNLEAAVEDCTEEDQRTDQTKVALDVIRDLTRGDMLANAFWKALGERVPGIRQQGAGRVLVTIKSVIGKAVT